MIDENEKIKKKKGKKENLRSCTTSERAALERDECRGRICGYWHWLE